MVLVGSLDNNFQRSHMEKVLVLEEHYKVIDHQIEELKEQLLQLRHFRKRQQLHLQCLRFVQDSSDNVE